MQQLETTSHSLKKQQATKQQREQTKQETKQTANQVEKTYNSTKKLDLVGRTKTKIVTKKPVRYISVG